MKLQYHEMLHTEFEVSGSNSMAAREIDTDFEIRLERLDMLQDQIVRTLEDQR